MATFQKCLPVEGPSVVDVAVAVPLVPEDLYLTQGTAYNSSACL